MAASSVRPGLKHGWRVDMAARDYSGTCVILPTPDAGGETFTVYPSFRDRCRLSVPTGPFRTLKAAREWAEDQGLWLS
jgi:hypothetical protein